jgi:hypothetical protein
MLVGSAAYSGWFCWHSDWRCWFCWLDIMAGYAGRIFFLAMLAVMVGWLTYVQILAMLSLLPGIPK